MIEVITFNDVKRIDQNEGVFVVTVSKSKEWLGLSPFAIGPCNLWNNMTSKNMENSWQMSKCYKEHLEDDGTVGDKWLTWAKKGWDDSFAYRYPMGKGAIPLFSVWNWNRLGYVEARKAIYIPLYKNAVEKTDAWKKLQEVKENADKDNKNLYLIDYDAYRHKKLGMSYEEVVNNPNKKMGHAFVLAMMLEDEKTLEKVIGEGIDLKGE